MKILIISYFFPPYNSIGSVRVGKTAKYLHQFGHDVTVISNQGNHWDQSVSIEIPENKNIKIDSKPFDELITEEYASRSMISKLWFRIVTSIKTRNVFYLLADSSWSWYPNAVKVAEKHIQDHKPDIIYSTALPISSHFIARKLSQKYAITWVAEYRDLWSGDYGAGISVQRSIVQKVIEKWLLRPVKGIVTVSKPLASYFESHYKKSTCVVYNGYDKDESIENKIGEERSRLPIRIVYTGNFYEGYDPSILFKAIQKLDESGDKIEVNFYTSQSDKIQPFIDKYNIQESVNLFGLVPYQDSIKIQMNADILLFLSYNHSKYRGKGILSGKVFEYIAAGHPIISIGSDDEHLLIQQGIMKHFDSAENVQARLEEWILEKKAAGLLEVEDRPEKQFYTRKEQTKVLDQFLEEVNMNSVNR